MKPDESNYKYGHNYNRNLDIPTIAKLVKQQLCREFPKSKWSVTTGYKSVTIALMEYTENVLTHDVNEDSYPITVQVHIDKGVRVKSTYGAALTPLAQGMLYRAVVLAESFNFSEIRVYDHPGNADIPTDSLFTLSVYIGSYDKPFNVKKI